MLNWTKSHFCAENKAPLYRTTRVVGVVGRVLELLSTWSLMADSRAVDPRFTPMVRFSSMRFVTYTAKEIKSISCKLITNPETFDHLLHPNPGGLYDRALGPSDKQELCGTCGLNYVHCPGHLGHIALPLPVFHPIFFTALYQVLRTSCFSCHRLLASRPKARLLKGQMQLLDNGLVSEALELEAHAASNPDGEKNVEKTADKVTSYVESCLDTHRQGSPASFSGQLEQKSKHLTDRRRQLVSDFLKSTSTCTKCPHCLAPVRKVRHDHQSKVFLRGLSPKQATAWMTANKKEKALQAAAKLTVEEEGEKEEEEEENETVQSCQQAKILTPLSAQKHLRKIWRDDPLLLSAVFSSMRMEEGEGGCPTDLFFLDVIAVPPSRFRPVCCYIIVWIS